MEITQPKYMQNKNQVRLQLPTGSASKVTRYDADNHMHYFNLQSDDYEFLHRTYENGKPVSTIEAIPISIFEN